MTWPFENDTSAITKKLALKSIKADRQKLLYTSLTIAIAVTLIMTLSMTLLSIQKKIQLQADSLPQAVMYHVLPDTYEQIQNDPAIESTIIQYSFPEIDYKNRISIHTIYCDNPVVLSNASLQGELPQELDEIALSSESLSYLPEDTGLGSVVLLDLGNGEQEYKITGIITLNAEFPNEISVYCSQKYLFQAVKENSIEYTLFLFLNQAKTISQNDAQTIVNALTEKYSVDHNDVIVNSRYFTLSERNITINELLDYLLIALVVLVAAAVVIYNIFHISITRKIQEYGQLRTIGMTSKQMKQLIMREGRRIALPSIVVGIIVGAVLGYIILPEGWNTLNFVEAALFSFVFGILTVSLSIHSPAKMASKTSPMEALRFSSYSIDKSNKRNRRYRITPLRLAILNLGRSKKKSFLTVLSLGLCGVMLIACASVQNSLSEIHMARANEFQYGDFKLEFEGNDSLFEQMSNEAQMYGNGALQAHSNVFSSELEQEILSIDGVNGIKKWYATTALFEVDGNENGQTTVYGYTADELEKMNRTLVSGVTDPAILEQENGIVVNVAENVPQEVYGWTPKLGDQITLSFWSNLHKNPVQKTYTIMAITDGLDGYQQIFRLPLAEIRRLTGYDITSDWEIVIDEKQTEMIEAQLENILAETPELSLSTLHEYVDALSGQYKSGIFMVYILVLFLACFGIINLVNLTVTNQLIRRKENGILLAVGLTRRQLCKTRIFEGEALVIGSILIASLIGIPVGYLAANTFRITGAVEQYIFPFKEYSIFLVVLIVIDILLEFILNRSMKKQSLIEQMRAME